MKQHLISLTMGDWSHDGHGWTEVVNVMSSLTLPELKAAYKKGVKIVDVDLTEDVASDYEDREFPEDVIEKLEKHGFKKDEFLEPRWKDETKFDVPIEGFWQVWMFIAKVGDPTLEYEEVERTQSNINIGGYGMFSS